MKTILSIIVRLLFYLSLSTLLLYIFRAVSGIQVGFSELWLWGAPWLTSGMILGDLIAEHIIGPMIER